MIVHYNCDYLSFCISQMFHYIIWYFTALHEAQNIDTLKLCNILLPES